MRASGRHPDQLRPLVFEVGFAKYAEGSCLVKFGETHVLCTASLEERVPPFLRNKGTGWITAEYGMLPRATHTRTDREAVRGKQNGRTQEIQRLIGRALRSVVNLRALGERQITIDCDVLQADGGTRTAAISGAYVALYKALEKLAREKRIPSLPLTHSLAAVSCGLVDGTPVLDLDYQEDCEAEADANFVLTEGGDVIEVQLTAEKAPFNKVVFDEIMALAQKGVREIAAAQRAALGLS